MVWILALVQVFISGLLLSGSWASFKSGAYLEVIFGLSFAACCLASGYLLTECAL